MKPFDASGTFQPTANGNELRRLAVKGAGATVLSSALSLGVQIIATVVLARLLTPQDFGLVTMVTTFSLLLVNFGLNGFTEAVVQREEINHFLASNIFWINLGAGVLLTLLFAVSGSLLARFYGTPKVLPVAVGISATILVTSTSVLHLALLKRAMRFSTLSVNDIVARAVAVGVSILMGWRGWGYWALVAGAIAQPLSQAIGAWTMCRWVPGFPRRVEGTASVVRFALDIYGRFSVNYFARNMDNILVGWRFSAPALGFYKKAYDLFALSAAQLVSPLTSVAVAALSRLNRDSAQYRRYLLNSIAVMAFVGMGLGADLTLVGKDVIRLLLGPGWDEAGRIFTFFGPGIGIMLVYGTHGWIHLSIGRADRWFRWGLVEFAVTGILFLLALPLGPVGIAIAWTASFWLLTVPGFWYAGKPFNLGVEPILTVVWRYLVASLLAGLGTFLMVRSIPTFSAVSPAGNAAMHVGTTSFVFAILYLGAVILLHGSCGPLYQFAGLLREMVPSRKFLEPVVGVAVAGSGVVP